MPAPGRGDPGSSLSLLGDCGGDVSIEDRITSLHAAGFNPDTLVLTPTAAEAIDVMVSGISGGSADFVFTPGAFGPDRIFLGASNPLARADFDDGPGRDRTSALRIMSSVSPWAVGSAWLY